ncbi:hypothetical protein KAI87_08000, partial [Myxococcota bacterium]|nr:hypothetical protein [Myxococcota bacterium]
MNSLNSKTSIAKTPIWVWIVTGLIIFIGLATIRSSGSVLLTGTNAGKDVGHTLPLVLWFNFATGFAFIA